MRKDRGLDGVGEGERGGHSLPTKFNRYYQQNSIDKRFKTTLCRVFPQN
jgi:hypothetical protein